MPRLALVSEEGSLSKGVGGTGEMLQAALWARLQQGFFYSQLLIECHISIGMCMSDCESR